MSLTDSDADEIFPTDLFVQPLDRYVEPLNVPGLVNTEGESDEPLFQMTITRFTKLNFTSIGACSSHILCTSFSTFLVPADALTGVTSDDTSGAMLFARQLSQFYQGLEPVDPPPYFEPKAIKFPEPSKPPSPTYRRYDLSAPPPWEHPERKAAEFVAFRLKATQLTEIRNCVAKVTGQPRIARVDIVLALLARCLSEVEPGSRPIDTISYVVDVRSFIASPATRLILS